MITKPKPVMKPISASVQVIVALDRVNEDVDDGAVEEIQRVNDGEYRQSVAR